MKLKLISSLAILFFSTQIFSQEKVNKNRFGIEVVGYYPFQELTYEPLNDYYELNNIYMLQINCLMNRSLSSKTDLIFGLGFEYMNSSEKDYSMIFPNDIDPVTGPNHYLSWIEFTSHNFILSGSSAIKFKASSKPSHYYLKTGLEGRLGIDFGSSMKWQGNVDTSITAMVSFAYAPQVPQLKLAGTVALGRHFGFKNFNFFAEARGMYLPGNLFREFRGVNYEISPVGIALGSFF